MKTVKVSNLQLRQALVDNLAKHRETYLKAFEGYRKRAIQELTKRLNDIEDGKNVDLTFYLTKPVNYSSSYEKAIAMLDMSIDDTVELTDTEFSQYVLDEWGWKNTFTASTAMYGSVAE